MAGRGAVVGGSWEVEFGKRGGRWRLAASPSSDEGVKVVVEGTEGGDVMIPNMG